MKTAHHRTRSLATLARIARRRLVVRVRPLALAAAVALGSPAPWVMAQTVITPLQGAGQTATVVSTQGNQTTVSTQSLRDGNAFSTYSRFQVGQGDVVQLAVPQGANWWVNIVRDQRVRVDGRLESRLLDGRIGGNILFVDSHGFAVGPSGQVDVGRLTFAAPSTTFVDGLLAGGGLMSGAAVGGLLAGQFERSATGAVDIRGRVSARDGVSLMAGHGADAQRAVSITGQVVVQGRVAGSAVNLGDLKSLTPLQDRDGVIDITTPGSITLDGVLISDSSHWRQAGAVRVVAGQDIAVGANAYASASGAVGSGAAGGQVTLFAQRDIANTPGATLRARGDGAGAGGAIEYSGLRQLNLSGMRFDAGSDTGAAGLVFVDPDDAVVQGINLTGGAHFVYGGDDTMTVRSGAVINTRKVASGADATNASVVSTGNSGNIVLKAPRITVEAGALLDASVVNAGGSSHQAGDITLTAENSSSWVTLLGLANADASIDVAGTLKGRNVTLLASIESSAVYDGVSAALTEKGLSLLAESLGSPLALSLAYTEATGNATVNVRGTAVLAASQDLRITALADRSAGAELQVGSSNAANLSAGFARIAGTTSVDVASGAQLSAGEDIALVAASKTSIGMTSAAAGETDDKTGAANVASVVFAGSLSDVSTRVNVAAGAALTSGGSTEAQAFHSGNYETSAEVTVYGGGTAGVVGALSLQTSTTSAELGGTVHAGGDVRVTALNAVVKNSISATAETAQKAPDEELKLPESLELSTDDAKQELQLGFLAMAEKLSATSEEASGGSAAESKPSALKLAGAMTWSESNHTTRASLGAGAQVRAGGHAVVDAQTLVGQLQSVALSEAASETEGKDASKVALSVAFNYANHQVSTRAQLGAGATVDAAQVAVHAATDIPEFYSNGLPLDWSSFSSAYANLVGGTSFLLDGFNTRVGSTAAGKTLAAAGAVNLTFMKNDTRAWVDTGAKITTTVADGLPWSYGIQEVGFDSDLVEMLIPSNTYTLDKDLGVLGDFVSTTREAPAGPAVDEIRFTRSFSGSTVVRAQNNVQTLHHAGGDAPEAGGSGTSVGGTFSMVDRRNTAIAGIADRAEITTQRLDVNAQTTDWLITISPTSGKGAGVAANGIASYNKLHETTVASISREALVTAPTVNVEAQLSLGVIAITGAVSRSENSGVGIGLALNEMTGDTRAYVGDNDTDGGGPQTAEGATGAIRTGALSVRARTDGMAVAVGVAG
ncbi:MAG: leukotoxin LktA family filamentous adhesin, partial [Hydrogenophaga sp.]|nr:leukotoxin LktA family filamentous adhesin [Hydrogenophaga sp.]